MQLLRKGCEVIGVVTRLSQSRVREQMKLALPEMIELNKMKSSGLDRARRIYLKKLVERKMGIAID
ncbi:hypothetical protein [Synechococcus sp. 1G10]|uniref:hypothetical protein n=1 Tax=Synechococcus sp. 1G10 TaxID=2025605 RepID=UPI000B982CB5|nr:hypothetical protein [Synechococcus sp. 1G10]